MKFNRKRLIEELRAVMPAVDDKAALLKGADALQFRGGRVYTYNDEIALSVETHLTEILAGDGEEEMAGLECAIRAKELFALLQKIPQDELSAEITEDGKNLQIAGKGFRAELPVLDAHEDMTGKLEGLGFKKKWQTLPDNFQMALRTCAIERNTSNFNGVVVSGNRMYSADHSRLNRFTLDKEMPSFWIADSAAAQLARLPKITHFQINDSWVHFKSHETPREKPDSIDVWFSAKRLRDDNFPTAKIDGVIEKHAPAEGDVLIELPPEIPDALDRATIFAESINNFQMVAIDVDKKGVTVHAERSGAGGRYKEVKKWDEGKVPKIEKAFSFLADGNMLRYALSRSSSFFLRETVIKNITVERLVFDRPNFRHVVSTVDKSAK